MSVLLVTVDCLRSDHVGCYGYDRPTSPTMDLIASRGVALNGLANSPGTRWALQTIHTGAYHGQFNGVGLPEGFLSLAQMFQNEGYTTGGFVCNGFLTQDYNYHIGFDDFYDVNKYWDNVSAIKSVVRKYAPSGLLNSVLHPLYQRLNTVTSSEGYRPDVTDSSIVDDAVSWIQNQSKEWFAWVHLMDAHTPYARWNSHLAVLRGDTDIEHVAIPDIQEGNETDQATVDAYDSGIRSADSQLARFLNVIDDETTILITGDHGEEFGKYGDFHTPSLYSSMTQVPFIIQSPELEYNSTGRVSEQAQHIDIAPTLAVAEGISPAEHWVGKSILTPSKESRTVWQDVDDQVGSRIGERKYIESKDGDVVGLYRSNYNENDTSLSLEANSKMVQQLKESVKKYVGFCESNPLGIGAKDDFDETDLSEEVEENLRELGYME